MAEDNPPYHAECTPRKSAIPTVVSAATLQGIVPTAHDTIYLNAAYQGDLQGTARLFAGRAGTQSGAATYPAALTIEPGNNWCNFIGAHAAGVPYVMTKDTVELRMIVPSIIQCAEVFPARTVVQVGAANIRLNWPLVYAVPGTMWQLTIPYQTPTPWDDDGPGPNLESYLHTEVWRWQMDVTTLSLGNRLRLFHDVPAGLSESPLISNDDLCSSLITKLGGIEKALDAYDNVTAGLLLGDFEMDVMDNCISVAPPSPSPGGPGTGILNTSENPACCALLADAEYVGYGWGGCWSPAATTGTQPSAFSAQTPYTQFVTIGDNETIIHSMIVVSPASLGDSGGVPTAYRGYDGTRADQVPFPGVLGLLPGTDWANFVSASESGVPYTLDGITLAKQSPGSGECSNTFESHSVTQSGSDYIRLWWPLLYDAPGTTYSLALNYHTDTDEQFPGETTPTKDHSEEWRWEVGMGLPNLVSLARLFDTLPFGRSSVPLISDETLHQQINERLTDAGQYLAVGDTLNSNVILGGLQSTMLQACTGAPPAFANPTGAGTGIAGTAENPACCYLYIGLDSLLDWQAYTSVALASRLAQDGQPARLDGPLVVTMVDGDWLYAQNPDRSGGIKVLGSTAGISPGYRIGVRGIMDTAGPERVIRATDLDTLDPSLDLPRALGILTREVGGSGQGLLPGFPGATGLWNGGLRVMVTGVVRGSYGGYFYLDDGCGLRRPSEFSGLRIVLPDGAHAPEDGSKVSVTGVSSWYLYDASTMAAILMEPPPPPL